MPKEPVPPLSEKDKDKFESIKQAVQANELALVRSSEKATDKPVALLCAVFPDPEGGDEYLILPMARLLEDDEFEGLNNPAEDVK